MKKKLLITALLVAIVTVSCILVNHMDRTFPVELTDISKIEFYENTEFEGDKSPKDYEKDKLLAFQNKEDIAKISQIFSKAQREGDSSLSCPFSIQAVLNSGSKSTILEFGTDGCGFFIYKNRYYRIPQDDFKILENFLLSHGLDIHKYI